MKLAGAYEDGLINQKLYFQNDIHWQKNWFVRQLRGQTNKEIFFYNWVNFTDREEILMYGYLVFRIIKRPGKPGFLIMQKAK